MASWCKWRRLMNVPLWFYLPAIFFKIKGWKYKTISSYMTLVKWQKVYLLPVRDNGERGRGGEEPQTSKKLLVKHINCPERTTLPVTDITWHFNTMVTGNGCNSVDWIHLALEIQVPVVEFFECVIDFNVTHISCNTHVGLWQDQQMHFSVWI